MGGSRKLHFSELKQLKAILRKYFPQTKDFFQLATDIQNKKMSAEIYVDTWPNFTTIISKEERPRISENADLGIYSRQKERIFPLINEARLLDDIGEYQIIRYKTAESDASSMPSYLLECFQSHPVTKKKTSQVVSDYPNFSVVDYQSITDVNLQNGFNIRSVSPDYAEFVAQTWSPWSIKTTEIPTENKVQYIRDIMSSFDVLGVHEVGVDHPVSWVGRRPGGELFMAHTLKSYRQLGLHSIVFNTLRTKCLSRGDQLSAATQLPANKIWGGFQNIGRSQTITIQ